MFCSVLRNAKVAVQCLVWGNGKVMNEMKLMWIVIASLHSGVLQLCLLFAIGHQQTQTLHGGPWVTLFFNSFLHEMWVDNLYCRDTHDLLKTCWKIKDIHKIGLALCISLSGTACIWRHAFDGLQIQLQLQIWIFSFYYDIHGMEYKPASDYPALLYKVEKSLF